MGSFSDGGRRGERGWGSTPLQFSTFQQNNSEDYVEIAADMFLNWVYYNVSTPYGSGFKNRTWRTIDTIFVDGVEIKCNTLTEGCIDPNQPGTARFNWMENKVTVIIQVIVP
jgi:hypothetical protein